MTQSTTAIVAHTPGPWHVEPAPSPSSMKSIRNEAGKAIAFVNRGPAAEANERLIAAAPTMKDAGNTLAAYVYSILNPGEIPATVRAAMAVFEAQS